jgi:hypothetical protein
MPFRIDDNVVTLDGHCSVEEAQPLYEALRGLEEPIFDLGGASGLHTAIVQLILASSGGLRGTPSEPALAACFRSSPRF